MCLLEDVDFGVAVGRGQPGGGVGLLLALRLCGLLVEGVVRPGVVVALAVARQVPMFGAQDWTMKHTSGYDLLGCSEEFGQRLPANIGLLLR